MEAFLAASREGDIERLLTLLAPDVVRRADQVALRRGQAAVLRGAREVADETRTNIALAQFARPILVDGALGVAIAPRGRLRVVLRLTITDNLVSVIDAIGEPSSLDEFDLTLAP
ncbi:hypothetical protein EV193_11186 [Herbihabitans rhizosphaerae]|uniref:SnoaL-like protein n=1 Tax=Herbihabitans rhizosphaerae TaxID=1872711 RepID=A0A4Q7KFM1_9PSEU|nr:hypothetical protein EV193_11186 [Herbihabitans rhizosphaerae]